MSCNKANKTFHRSQLVWKHVKHWEKDLIGFLVVGAGLPDGWHVFLPKITLWVNFGGSWSAKNINIFY
jgi:hypothetical protein